MIIDVNFFVERINEVICVSKEFYDIAFNFSNLAK